MKKYIVVAILSVFLSACNQDKSQSQGSVFTPTTLSGTYTSGKDTFIFTSDGKVTAKNKLFPDKVTTYAVEEGKVKLTFAEGYPMTFSLNADGSLTSDSNTNYKKTD